MKCIDFHTHIFPDRIAKQAVEALAAEYSLHSMSIRCWTELQSGLGISPCVVNGVMAEQGLPVACEVDTGSAVMMRLLGAVPHGHYQGVLGANVLLAALGASREFEPLQLSPSHPQLVAESNPDACPRPGSRSSERSHGTW